jgi:transcriptional regulator with XRE-family HTH domain
MRQLVPEALPVNQPIPPQWLRVMEARGLSTIRRLAQAAGVSPQTIKRMVQGEGDTSERTIEAVADVLFEGDRNQVWRLLGEAPRDYTDWALPDEARLLTPKQRDAVRAVILSMVDPGAKAGDGDDRDAAPMTEELDPIEPKVADVLAARRARELAEEPHLDLAARRGQSKGRQARQTQDDAGERPDPEGPEGGA